VKSHLGAFLLSTVSGTWRFCMVIRSLLPISLETMHHDPKKPVLLIALKIMRHAKLCLSMIMFLICVCWHPERMCRSLSTCGQRGQVWLVESLNNTTCFWLYRVPVLCFIMISSWITPFSHKFQTRALLSGLLPYKPVTHNPCPLASSVHSINN